MRAHRRRTTAALAAATAAAALAPVLLAAPATAHHPHDRGPGRLAERLVAETSGRGAYRHLAAFQRIADANGGNRAAGTPGYDASAAYVHDTLKKAGYRVTYQEFDIHEAVTKTERTTVLGADGAAARELPTAAFTFTRSTPAGGLTAPVAAARVDDTPGCDAADYAGTAFTGRIALVKRGACTFVEKQNAAHAAGALGVIVYNHSGTTPVRGGFGSPAEGLIPSAGISLDDGEALAAAAARGEVRVRLDLDQRHVKRTTRNVIAETRAGRADRVVTVGAHLDSVKEGPGINDNGSGSAGLLETALELAEAAPVNKPGRARGKQIANKVRFTWWSGEELGLLGSEHYVSKLSAQQKRDIALYLNFDMIASPNPAQFVYDGDDSDRTGAGAGPAGSAHIEALINGFLDRKGKPHEGSDFDGRSDYGPFIASGIPAGGTFTGAEGIKTEEQARRYGGRAGVAYDPNYHGAGDDLDNLDHRAFDTNVDVIAHAVGTYAQDLGTLGK
ncbi:M28 family peptidase [Streptomyces sp. NPDC012888]|uniref:M28 family peptidase n=1 Tax=Streptomyces sp. NPDC012888 TaxID=3364855 RepID=UPI0036C8B9D8